LQYWNAGSSRLSVDPLMKKLPLEGRRALSRVNIRLRASAGIDLALALVQEDLGHQIAMQVARSLVVYLKRAGGQSQYSAPLAAQVATDAEFAELHGWIREHLHEDLDLDALAKHVGMSTRTLERHHIAKLGQTPLKVLETMRLETARLSLEDASLSLKSIARRTGFGDVQRLRRAFNRKFGVAPAEYRERFLALEKREPKPGDGGREAGK
jgi:transcriptional regulator GlxA family with amidase domain